MNRREYIRSACGVSLALVAAGCTQGGAGGQVTETVVEEVRNSGGDGGGAAVPPDVTEADAPEIEFVATEVNRVDDNEVVVRGGVRNASDRPFGHLELEGELYDANETEDNLLDGATATGEFQYLSPGQTWSYTLSFPNVKVGTVGYVALTATAELADQTATTN